MRSPRYSRIRVPLGMCASANTPRPCTGEFRTSTRVEVTIGGPPLVGCDWSKLCFPALLFILPFFSYCNGRLDRRVMLVVHDLEVFESVIKNAGGASYEIQPGQCKRHT